LDGLFAGGHGAGMKVREVILRAISKQFHWFEAARILGLSARQLEDENQDLTLDKHCHNY